MQFCVWGSVVATCVKYCQPGKPALRLSTQGFLWLKAGHINSPLSQTPNLDSQKESVQYKLQCFHKQFRPNKPLLLNSENDGNPSQNQLQIPTKGQSGNQALQEIALLACCVNSFLCSNPSGLIFQVWRKQGVQLHSLNVTIQLFQHYLERSPLLHLLF